MLKYIDEIPMTKGQKQRVYNETIKEFAEAGKPFALVDNDDMPKTGGKHRFDKPYFSIEATAYALSRTAKNIAPHIRVMRRDDSIYLINTELAKDYKS